MSAEAISAALRWPVMFDAFGSPAPQGSKRYVGTSRSGRGLLVESSKRVKPWRQDVKAAVEAWMRANDVTAPLDAPLVVRMVFTVPKPTSAPKRRQTWPCRLPDLSKLCRSTEDALTDAGLIRDDARIVEYARLAKVFPGEDPDALGSPGVRICIGTLEPMATHSFGHGKTASIPSATIAPKDIAA